MLENRCFRIDWDETFWALIQKGTDMKRDDDYLRELLLELEAGDDWMHLSVQTLGDSAEEAKRHFHILMLMDAGFLAPMTAKMQTFRITNTGHDFLAMIRSDDAWSKVKATGSKLGGASVQMLYRIAEGYARQKLADLGVPLA